MRSLTCIRVLLCSLALPIAACDSKPEGRDPPRVTVAVNGEITPHHAELFGFAGNDPRPVAALMDDDGYQVEFVTNELMVVTADSAALDDFLVRWNGVLLDTLESPEPGDRLGTVHLVRIDATHADTERLAADLMAIEPERAGHLEVSSEGGMRLLAAAAREQREGMTVGVNWVGRSHALHDRVSTEAPVGPNGYVTNAFSWPHLTAGGAQDMGVAEAWRSLFLSGRIGNRVKIAVIDMGFKPDQDFPADWEAISIVPGKSPTNSRNNWGCGSSSCPWHGTHVSSTVAARPNNSYGSAGTAGPIADLLMIYSGYDYYSAIVAVVVARQQNAKIINMSFGARVPTIVAWTVYPFEWATDDAWNHGKLLFAAAGNDGENVDAVHRFLGINFGEKAWHTPCENDGVICVGGIAKSSTDRHPDSNYGSEHVDIWAPFVVWVGPDPDNPANQAQEVTGTSFASPFAAGVAALIWAAEPSLGARQVRDVLYSTARPSPDSRVNRYVNAYDAVMQLIDSQEPFIEVVQPPEDSEWLQGHSVHFEAQAGDLEDEIPVILWTSDIDGIVGTGLSWERDNLSYGTHIVTATAYDTDGNYTWDDVRIHVNNSLPVVEIIEPTAGSSFVSGELITFRGESTDVNYYPSFTLPESAMTWRSDADGVLGTGHQCTASLTPGTHTISLAGTDDFPATDTDWVIVTVQPAGGDQPPTVTITQPDHDILSNDLEWQYDGYDPVAGMSYKDASLAAVATDPEDGTLGGASLVWTTNRTDLQPAELGTGASLTARLYASGCSTEHTITLTATDSWGHVRTAVRVIRLWVVC